jgi:predicted Zn-dependent protease
MRNQFFKSLGALALVLALCGCEKGGREHLDDARQELNAGEFAQAIASANQGLATAPNDVTTWGLELVILEAQARAGNGAEARGQLVKLAEAHPERVSATDYSSTAQLLQAADQKPEAIELLDLGAKRFPDDPVITRMIEESVAGGSDPEELEMLRSLGYIE